MPDHNFVAATHAVMRQEFAKRASQDTNRLNDLGDRIIKLEEDVGIAHANQYTLRYEEQQEPEEDADGEDEDFDPVVEEDDKDGEYVLRRSRSMVIPSEPGRCLRSRSSTGMLTRYNPYVYDGTHPSSPASHEQAGSPLSSNAPDGAPSRRRTRQTSSIPVPVPVPNLTKKSRGRRVPTALSLEHGAPTRKRGLAMQEEGEPPKRGKGLRTYMCKVQGCGKCFARGEHLKRHVRSIHTYEKREAVYPPSVRFF